MSVGGVAGSDAGSSGAGGLQTAGAGGAGQATSGQGAVALGGAAGEGGGPVCDGSVGSFDEGFEQGLRAPYWSVA